jgi:hypothetical protein
MDIEIINGKKYKKCKDTEIRNPVSNRCVLKTSKLGKQILESKKSKSPIAKKTKNIDDDCIKWKTNKLINPTTGRAIKEGKGIYNDLLKK